MEQLKAARLLTDWRPFSDVWAIVGNIDNNIAIWDNLQAFDAAPHRCRIEGRAVSYLEGPPFGVMLLHTPKRKRAEVCKALDNYYKRMCWEYDDFERVNDEIWSLADQRISEE